jgi:hypothetical protein
VASGARAGSQNVGPIALRKGVTFTSTGSETPSRSSLTGSDTDTTAVNAPPPVTGAKGLKSASKAWKSAKIELGSSSSNST